MIDSLISRFKNLPKLLFFIFIVKPLVYVLLGLNIRNKDRLPKNGPAIIVANHNSHLDVLVLMALFETKLLHKIRPIGAADYFFTNKIKAWCVTNLMDAIPICRTGEVPKAEVLKPCEEALLSGDMIIIFPEGTRGEPEHLGNLHKGVLHLANKFPEVPVVPIFLHGLGKSLPKGEGLFVPFFVDVVIDDSLNYQTQKDELLAKVRDFFVDSQKYFIARA